MQIQLDINDIPKSSLGDPLKDLQREATKTSILVQEVKRHDNPLVDVHRGEEFVALENVVKTLKAGVFTDGPTRLLQAAVKNSLTQPDNYNLAPLSETDPLCPGISLVVEKGLYWCSHHLRCGVIIYVLRILVRQFAIAQDASHCHVLGIAHMYNICHNLFPGAPHFPDLEFFMQRQDLERFFYGKIPQDITDAKRQLELIQYGITDAIKGHTYRTISQIGKRLMRSRFIQSPSNLDSVLEDRFRLHDYPLTPQEAHASTRRFLNSFGDKKREHERMRLFNWPADAVGPEGRTYHRLFFHEYDKIWDPVPTLRSVMLWLKADAVSLNFCTPKLGLLCSDILRDILDMFRKDPAFEKDF